VLNAEAVRRNIPVAVPADLEAEQGQRNPANPGVGEANGERNDDGVPDMAVNPIPLQDLVIADNA
jgi:hypothetical protein